MNSYLILSNIYSELKYENANIKNIFEKNIIKIDNTEILKKTYNNELILFIPKNKNKYKYIKKINYLTEKNKNILIKQIKSFMKIIKIYLKDKLTFELLVKNTHSSLTIEIITYISKSINCNCKCNSSSETNYLVTNTITTTDNISKLLMTLPITNITTELYYVKVLAENNDDKRSFELNVCIIKNTNELKINGKELKYFGNNFNWKIMPLINGNSLEIYAIGENLKTIVWTGFIYIK